MPAKKTAPDWDRPPGQDRKPRADSKLKNLPEGDQETLWLLMHPTDADTPAYTLEQALVHVLEEHGIECALSTLGEWRSWYALRRRMRSAAARAEQAKLEWIKENPDATPADLERLAQMVFTSESLESGDVKAYVQLAKLRLMAEKYSLERAKLEAAVKTKIEQGLDALLVEIQGNPRALKLFHELKEAVAKA